MTADCAIGWMFLLRQTVLLLANTGRPTYSADLGDTLRTIGWDTSVHMAGLFRPWGLTVWYLGPKCLLDTLVLVPKCRDTLDLPEQC